MKSNNNNILLLLILLLTTACDYMPKMDEVIPDRRTEYKKSESMPDLEVPPDLTVNAEADPLLIPHDEANTLSKFENQKKMRHGAAGAQSAAQGDEQWLSVQGTNADIWPKLKEFWTAKGYTLDLDDAELGVLETNWQEIAQDGGAAMRTKYNIFAEAGSSPGSTVLFLSSNKQEKIAGEDGKVNWVDTGNDVETEKQMLGELNLLFYGKPATPAPAPAVAKATDTSSPAEPASSVNISQKAKAELQSLGEGKVFLSLPDEFNRAWGLAERAILDAGIIIDGQDRVKGTYNVTYSGQQAEGTEKKKGLLSKLKFWGDKEKAYQISLTGVGKKTELVVLNENSEWADQDEATHILTLLQQEYNSY